MIIDLDANPKNNFRQVDHRTINWIIFKNVKYSLGKKSTDQELPLKGDRHNKWDASKLVVNNWFSATAYYKLKSITDNDNVQVVETRNTKQDMTMAADILNTEMHSGLAHDAQEKLARTEVVEKIMFAGECVMTVNFNTKVDKDHIASVLSSNTGKKADLKKVAREVVTGKETVMTCYLGSTENKLGRSLVMDLNAKVGMNYRQIDHRTINSVIIKNVKYIVK